MVRRPDEFIKRYRPKMISTVLTSKYPRYLETIFSPGSKHAEQLKSLIYQTAHIPVTQECLVLCQLIQCFSAICHDLTVKIFWAKSPVLPANVLKNQVPKSLSSISWTGSMPTHPQALRTSSSNCILCLHTHLFWVRFWPNRALRADCCRFGSRRIKARPVRIIAIE